MMYDPENKFKDITEISVPIKITLEYSFNGVRAVWYHKILFPTIGKVMYFEMNDRKVEALLEFFKTNCIRVCQKCKHYRYRDTCYLLEDFKKEFKEKR